MSRDIVERGTNSIGHMHMQLDLFFEYLLKYGFFKKSFRKKATLTSCTLFPSQKGTCILPFCEEKSVQLVRVAFFRSDFLQNPYYKYGSIS